MISIHAGETTRWFHLRFSNGWVISVQIGPHNCHIKRSQPLAETTTSPNAEIAVWHRNSPTVQWPNNATMQGWVTPDRIARIIAYISNLPDNPSAWGSGSTLHWLGINGAEETLP